MKKIIERTENLIFQFSWAFDENKKPFTLNYEMWRYRENELIWLIRDTVPFFALTSEEYKKYKENDEISEINKNAFTRISKAKENKKWDYWELLLFLILKVFYKSEKFVTKVRLRSTKTEQIKWYDCAHFTIENNEPILWLWEAKFYKDISWAISESLQSVTEHLDPKYLKDELDILKSNIEINSDFPKESFNLIDIYLNWWKSLDELKIKVPILLTYESLKISSFNNIKSQDFINHYQDEFKNKFNLLTTSWRTWPNLANITFEFILIPLQTIDNIKEQLQVIENWYRF